MREITMIDFLAMRLEIPRMELKNPACLVPILEELLDIPAGLYPVSEWNETVSYLLRDNYYFSSVPRAKDFVGSRLDGLATPDKWHAKAVRHLRKWFLPVACGLAVFLLMQYVFMFCFVPSASMEPTIDEGSFILATRILGELEVGDIIVFEKDGTLLVKRIAAGPSQTIFVNDGTGSYSLYFPSDGATELVVPAGCYFVVGDNEENSLDSRFWEDPYVQERMIFAKVFGE